MGRGISNCSIVSRREGQESDAVRIFEAHRLTRSEGKKVRDGLRKRGIILKEAKQ